MDYLELKGWVDVARGAVDLLKSAAVMLPKGEKRSAIEAKIVEAEDSLKRSNAKLAHELGLKLCDCTFPPNVMLWKENEKAHVCPNMACGRKKFQGMRISKDAVEAAGRPSPRGPNAWMVK